MENLIALILVIAFIWMCSYFINERSYDDDYISGNDPGDEYDDV